MAYLPYQAIELSSRLAHDCGCGRDVASCFAQDALDCSHFGLLENGSVVIRGGPVLDECGQVLELYEVRRPEQQRPVAKLLRRCSIGFFDSSSGRCGKVHWT